MKKGIKVTVNDDNTITIDWDETDPEYSFLNDLTEKEFSDLLLNQIKKITDSSND